MANVLRVLGSPNPGQSFGRGLFGPQATDVSMDPGGSWVAVESLVLSVLAPRDRRVLAASARCQNEGPKNELDECTVRFVAAQLPTGSIFTSVACGPDSPRPKDCPGLGDPNTLKLFLRIFVFC